MIWVFFKKNPVSHWFTGWVYANFIIHLSVGESQGYSPRRIRGSVYILVYSLPLRWIITRYLLFSIHAWPYARFFQKQGHAMLCYTWLCCVVLYCTVLCCAVCYTILDKLQFFNKMRACVREHVSSLIWKLDAETGAAEHLRDWGAQLVTQYWGTRHFFLLNLYNFKNIGGHVPPLPPPPPPYSAIPESLCMYVTSISTYRSSSNGLVSWIRMAHLGQSLSSVLWRYLTIQLRQTAQI